VFKSTGMRWVEHVTCMGERRDAYNVSVGKHEGKRPLERARDRWESNIKMVVKKWDGVHGLD
jgi:hypothetical protein